MPTAPKSHQPNRTPDRLNVIAFHASTRWTKLSKAFRRDNPLCWLCDAIGVTTPAAAVHHYQPVADCYYMRFDACYWISLCASCHNRITRIERENGNEAAQDVFDKAGWKPNDETTGGM